MMLSLNIALLIQVGYENDYGRRPHVRRIARGVWLAIKRDKSPMLQAVR